MTTPHWVAINLVNECGADTPKIGTFCAVLGHATYLSDAIGTDLFLSLFLRSLFENSVYSKRYLDVGGAGQMLFHQISENGISAPEDHIQSNPLNDGRLGC
ncbi:hypothetical protein K4L04_18375 [Phaeobacter inhibens]|uniref:hypothetical protein n=1 Tax=Phaeobacter inhibens TaxID=221822 RepID=UPI0021A73FAB|nr:hypothetical protein [Phaeobacter inhibens]UWR76364.1 hypothetical protein K4L04_18375 [Phaeobacter inhibens]